MDRHTMARAVATAAPRRMCATQRLALACCALLGCGTAQTAPLADMVRQALGADPAVAAAAAQARAAEERVIQARAAFGPTASLNGSYGNSKYYEEPANALRRLRSDQTTLQVTVPIWRGALFPALDAAQALQLQARAALAQVQSEAVQRLLESTFEVLKARDTLAHAQAQRVAAAEQLLAARRSFDVGTAPVTDLRDAEARVDAVAALVLGAESDLAMRRQVLAELAGRDVPELLQLVLDGSALPDLSIDGVASWLADAAATNPQVQQSRLALEAAEHEVRKAWLAHAPTADLTYSNARTSDNGTVTSPVPRAGTNNTLGVTVTVPLFASGATQSKVRESLAQRDKAQADVEVARRTVSLAVRQAFAAAVSAVAQARGLEAAVRSQELALRAKRRSYELGVKVNAEVLDAQSKLFEARRDLSRARYEAWNGLVKLKAQTGQLGEPELARLDALLVDAPQPELIVPRR